jgi:hypothetical protein
VGVERQEKVLGGRMRVGDDGAEREVQGRHFSGRRRWPGRELAAAVTRREFKRQRSAPSCWFAPLQEPTPFV